jgi:hypothetical protein
VTGAVADQRDVGDIGDRLGSPQSGRERLAEQLLDHRAEVPRLREAARRAAAPEHELRRREEGHGAYVVVSPAEPRAGVGPQPGLAHDVAGHRDLRHALVRPVEEEDEVKRLRRIEAVGCVRYDARHAGSERHGRIAQHRGGRPRVGRRG